MDRFVEFLINHYLLAGTFAALAVAFLVNEFLRGGKSVTPQGLSSLVNQQKARLIDVRDPAEFRAGHISGSENIPFSRIDEQLPQLKSDLTRPIVIVCNLGQVAGSVGQKLKAAGHTQVYKLEGGISNWKGQSLPLVKK
ncbi:MAG TPA: rhodanese-like domain-containing protein [Moraxellaceae bacterium]